MSQDNVTPELDDGEGSTVEKFSMSPAGVVGLNAWGSNVFEEFLPNLQWPWAASVYQEMMDNDPVISAVLYMSKQLIRKAGWTVEPASKSQADKECAEFVEECLHDMTHSWANNVSEFLSMLAYGWSFHEIVYKIRRGPLESSKKYKSKYTDGRIGWQQMPIRSQHSLYGWVFDDLGEPIAMEQQAAPDFIKRTIPFSRGILFRTEVTRNNPEGRSLLRGAYRPWYFKKRIEEIEGIGIERDLAGYPVLTAPEGINLWDPNNPEAKLALGRAESIVRNVRADKSQGLVLPSGWDFKLASSGGSKTFDTNAVINRYDQRIAITMLADIVMLGADKVGSFALAEVKKSLLAASLESQIQSVADSLNSQAVPELIRYNNFPGISGYPVIVPGQVEVPGLKELGDYFRATGMKLDEDPELMNYMRDIASMPPMDEEDFKAYQERLNAARNQTGNATEASPANVRDNPDNKESEEE